ncbi:MAG: single-stranded DNA-binding protein [Patescibacteria group bacterium]|jgi:single-strand DNA-binding protein|nr:single-stranded DNA-binding protein [Patescibacteria group bacterium]
MNLNKAMIIGNLTRDPETRTTPSGQNVASFSVATSLTWTDNTGQQQKKTEFHNIVAWRKLADICAQYLRKGSKVYIEGRLQTNEWTGQDGVKKYRTEIVADNMIMLDRANTNNDSYGNFNNNQTAPKNNNQEEELPTINADEEEIRVENIPF